MSDEKKSYVKRIKRDECICCGSTGTSVSWVDLPDTKVHLFHGGIPLCWSCALTIGTQVANQIPGVYDLKVADRVNNTVRANKSFYAAGDAFDEQCERRKDLIIVNTGVVEDTYDWKLPLESSLSKQFFDFINTKEFKEYIKEHPIPIGTLDDIHIPPDKQIGVVIGFEAEYAKVQTFDNQLTRIACSYLQDRSFDIYLAPRCACKMSSKNKNGFEITRILSFKLEVAR